MLVQLFNDGPVSMGLKDRFWRVWAGSGDCFTNHLGKNRMRFDFGCSERSEKEKDVRMEMTKLS
jgi:hypothetical protein